MISKTLKAKEIALILCAVGASGCAATNRSAQLDERERVLNRMQTSLEQRAAKLERAESGVRTKALKEQVGWKLQHIIVAARDLKPGEKLSDDNVMLANMPRRFIAESMLVPADMEVAIGRELVSQATRGSPLLWSHLRGVHDHQRLSKRVPKGSRAITISVTERSSVGRWVRPNDRVDVLCTLNKATTVTLLENVIVLATDALLPGGSTKNLLRYRTVTVLVLPEEAQLLVLAQARGSLYLTLRNAGDATFSRQRPTTARELLSPRGGRRRSDKRVDPFAPVRSPGTSKGSRHLRFRRLP